MATEEVKTEDATQEKSDLYIGTDSSYENASVETAKPRYDDDELEEYKRFGIASNSVPAGDSEDGFEKGENDVYPPGVEQDTRVQTNHGPVGTKDEVDAAAAKAETNKEEPAKLSGPRTIGK